jgi:hypothetical protein
MGPWPNIEELGVEQPLSRLRGKRWAVRTREETLVCPACEGSGRKDRDWRQTCGAGGGGAGGVI